MNIINCSLNTHFYYISIDLDPSHSTISCNFFLYTVQYTAIEMLAIVQPERGFLLPILTSMFPVLSNFSRRLVVCVTITLLLHASNKLHDFF